MAAARLRDAPSWVLRLRFGLSPLSVSRSDGPPGGIRGRGGVLWASRKRALFYASAASASDPTCSASAAVRSRTPSRGSRACGDAESHSRTNRHLHPIDRSCSGLGRSVPWRGHPPCRTGTANIRGAPSRLCHEMGAGRYVCVCRPATSKTKSYAFPWHACHPRMYL